MSGYSKNTLVPLTDRHYITMLVKTFWNIFGLFLLAFNEFGYKIEQNTAREKATKLAWGRYPLSKTYIESNIVLLDAISIANQLRIIHFERAVINLYIWNRKYDFDKKLSLIKNYEN